MKLYVVGFLFSTDRESVALIEKKRPAWQAGKLNGIGGRVEPGERFHDAMVREFEEETGVRHDAWHWALNLTHDEYELRVYHGFSEQLGQLQTTTDEEVGIYTVVNMAHLVAEGRAIPNLGWIVPLLLDTDMTWPITIDNVGN